jgi:hypothetical protein
MPVEVLARCLCGQVEAKLHLAPAETHARPWCHCGSCRYATGVLFLSDLPLLDKPSFVDRLRSYESSEQLTRYFCGTCGSHMLCHVIKDDSWDLCTGTVDKILDGGATLSQYIGGHEFLDDTVDGGLSLCLTNANGSDLDLFLQGPDQRAIPRAEYLSQLEQVSADRAKTEPAQAGGQLQASCHCGGVKYCISRPVEASGQISSPWPDLIVSSETAHAENKGDVKWWLRSTDSGTKYLAGTCACRSCRLASGVPIQTWAFVPLINIENPDGSQFDFKTGTLKQYTSYEGVYREFCKVCGATAFWHCEARPHLIDVSVGLLRAQEGARATQWLEWWTDRVSFKEHAMDTPLVAIFEKGLVAIKG